MFSSFIITFRETLEVALIVGIVLSYLSRIRQTKYNNVIYVGIVSGITASILGAVIFLYFAGGFEGRSEKIFEGITMLVGAFLLTTMIFWMMKQKHIIKNLERKIKREITQTHKFGLFFLIFVSVLREGIETVIFLGSASFISGENTLAGALGGIIAAVILGYVMFVGTKKINIKNFFNITNILLILFAGGLIAHGIHELQEAGIILTVLEHVWDINYVFNEKGTIGGIFKGLFGYNGNPSLIEVSGYMMYLVLIFGLWKNIEHKHKKYNV